MSETLHSVEGQDFIAPDESQRVDDPNTAESIARASHHVRSQASNMRAQGKEFLSLPNLSPETAAAAKEAMDRGAANTDALAEDVEQLHANMHKIVRE